MHGTSPFSKRGKRVEITKYQLQEDKMHQYKKKTRAKYANYEFGYTKIRQVQQFK